MSINLMLNDCCDLLMTTVYEFLHITTACYETDFSQLILTNGG